MTDIIGSQILKLKSNLKAVVVIVIVIVIVTIGLAVYLAWSGIEEEEIEEIAPVEKTIPEEMLPGEEGELEEGKTLEEVNPGAITMPVRPPGTPMPPVVSDTKGEIVSIENDAITIMGTGENFEDQKARILSVKFTAETITFEKGQKIRYNGFEGLNYLKPGEKILISSSENIRGKTEFKASYINKI